jgi:two-component system response regulator NreC
LRGNRSDLRLDPLERRAAGKQSCEAAPISRILAPVTSSSETDEAQPAADEAKVVLADDHSVVRQGLRLMLDAQAGLRVVAEAGDVETALRMVRAHRPAVLMLDLNMPGRASLDAIPELLESSPGVRIVVLTMQDEPALAQASLRAGASAYVLKDAAADELVHAVQLVLEGQTYLQPTLGARIAAQEPTTDESDDLSEREREVLRLIALGHTNGEIASQLFLSVRTVESHRAHIQQKLRLTTRAELVRYALDRGLIGSD